jgi:hypothetical protein
MDDFTKIIEILDGLATIVSNAFLVLLLLAVFFAGVAVCIGVIVWDTYECSIREAVAKAKLFFAKHFLRVASIF